MFFKQIVGVKIIMVRVSESLKRDYEFNLEYRFWSACKVPLNLLSVTFLVVIIPHIFILIQHSTTTTTITIVFFFKSDFILTRLRESTLMNLMNIVDKLDEMQLQDKLVRCIMGLQSDTEPSIRTNATIFLGRIASKLKESVRLVGRSWILLLLISLFKLKLICIYV